MSVQLLLSISWVDSLLQVCPVIPRCIVFLEISSQDWNLRVRGLCTFHFHRYCQNACSENVLILYFGTIKTWVENFSHILTRNYCDHSFNHFFQSKEYERRSLLLVFLFPFSWIWEYIVHFSAIWVISFINYWCTYLGFCSNCFLLLICKNSLQTIDTALCCLHYSLFFPQNLSFWFFYLDHLLLTLFPLESINHWLNHVRNILTKEIRVKWMTRQLTLRRLQI